ncbi:MAG: DUF763 domain-containing protein [Thermodesulfovibrio sp.]|nr:DUF763 domain-containing protein [Thermodesulfovibrio sp.]
MYKTGIANLPLHSGKAPQWLFRRMVSLAKAIVELMIIELGHKEVLVRLSDPFWFQSLGCVLGFDWHSSGVTTTVTGALKEALKDLGTELGLLAAGGKGSQALNTPQEIINYAEKVGFEPEKFIYASRLSAKVDNVAVQDGFNLYHHTMFFTPEGHWCVIQQGMSEKTLTARRYHWLSLKLKSFTEEPHVAVCCDIKTHTLNFVAKEASELRRSTILLSQQKPETLLTEAKKVLNLPKRHKITTSDINPQKLYKVFTKTYENQPEDFEKLLQIKGVGAATLRALALTAELVYGTPLSFIDPARFSFAHGGKDRTPYPVNKKIYDRTIEIFEKAIKEAKLGRQEKLLALRRVANLKEL